VAIFFFFFSLNSIFWPCFTGGGECFGEEIRAGTGDFWSATFRVCLKILPACRLLARIEWLVEIDFISIFKYVCGGCVGFGMDNWLGWSVEDFFGLAGCWKSGLETVN